MLETAKETCQMCGKEYEDVYVWPRAQFAPYWCAECTDQVNAITGGWIGAAYAASKRRDDAEETR